MRKKLFVVLFVVISLIVVISCDNEIELYKVTFDSQGGSTVAPVDVAKDAKFEAPTAPTKAGHVFAGWYKDSELTEAWTFASDTVTEDITLYAKWALGTDTAYKVEHYQQDISGDGYTLKETENLTGTTGDSVTATAQEYEGFVQNEEHDSQVTSGDIAADGSLVLKLYYDRKTYEVTFDATEGSSVESITGVRYGATITEPTAPNKTGYTFGGWYKEGLETAWTFASDTVTEALTLYAKWALGTATAYKVEHYQQNVSGDGYTLGETENLAGTTGDSVTATVKEYTGFAQNGEHDSQVASGDIAADGSLVLKLYYDRAIYTVSFNTDSGSAVDSITGVRYGATINKPDDPTKTGYTFVDWYKEVGLAQEWNFESDTVAEAITLYAKWTPNTDTAYKVEHYQQNANDGDYTLKDTEDFTGTTGDSASATAIVYTEFTQNTEHSSQIESGEIAADGSLILKLYYDRKTYTVTFDANEGSDVDSISARYDATISAPSAPTRTGYTFSGWYKEVELAQQWNFTNDKVTKALTLYAKWEPNTNTAYKVEHYQQNANDGDYTLKDTENLTGTTGNTATATAKVYTEFTQNTEHSSQLASGYIAADGSLVLKLYYDRKTYTVTFDANEGSDVDSISARYGATISAPSAPTKIWHDFDGWYKEAELSQQWDFESDTVIEDITLHAKWEKTYEIGDTGPGGGYVYYDRTEDATWDGEGWRYLEAAPVGWHDGTNSDPSIAFGYHRDSDDGNNTLVGGTSTEIGSGKANTDALVAAMGEGAYSKKSGDDKGLYAAKIAKDYKGEGFDDWFLPSLDELMPMYKNLKYEYDSFGDVHDFGDSGYWSSSEKDDDLAYRQTFDDKPLDYYPESENRYLTLLVRPARAFK